MTQAALAADDERGVKSAGRRRIEVTNNGQFWQWRWGSGKQRGSRYGGRFDDLSPERKQAYYDRKNIKARKVERRANDAN